ncbi:MAG TPA: hypothetical protein DEA96_13500 [Leptospiraceae bacterium]|nr:hypothetical protein [Spirochaetaceae bacterium]HBS05977.1 hypothetical protein [Leptospiraceae bacterium]|tara:strand:- start:22189 stop:23034 length:846 start_codon:yes stop_codon:yes gene_type:complete
MQWALLEHRPQKPDHPVLKSQGILVKLPDQWIAFPEADQEAFPVKNYPVLILETEDLEQAPVWAYLLRFIERNIPALARFTEARDMIPDGLIQALGWKAHYRSRDEWKQWAALSAASEELYMLYEFPLNVLRLWDRVDPSSRGQWMELWLGRGFKKNLVKEIIQYYHDLAPEQQEEALKQALEFSGNWKARSGSFPAEQIRDQLYRHRYPEISGLQEKVFKLQKNLPGHKKLTYLIPDHLEAGYLDLRLRIEADADVEELFELLREATRDGRLREVLNLIQ